MNVDIIIIGSGQAGVPLATRLAAAGKRVLIVERADLGGTCINTGCTPTKTMVASARAAHVARGAPRLGVTTGEVKVDLAAVVKRKDAVVAQWRAGVRRRLEGGGPNLTLVTGHARFVGEREIEVSGGAGKTERHRAETVILDVGGRPVSPALPGLDSVPWLDNKRLMELTALPEHLLVIGGGYIGCEFGQMFRRFGSRVTMADHGQHLLSREDPEVSSVIEEVFRKEGITLELGVDVARVARDGAGVAVELKDKKTLRGSHLLVATGRRPNTDDLGCAAGGVALDERGFIQTDDHYLTSAPGVYAVGDANGGPQFTHVSWDDHRLLYDLLMDRARRGRGGRAYPYTVFTDPQIAGVGLNETQARARGVDYELATMPFGSIARAIEIDETAGVLRLLIDPRSERVLGATLVGVEAGELLHIFVTLMQAEASVRAVVDAEYVHPTLAEGVQSLVMSLARFALK